MPNVIRRTIAELGTLYTWEPQIRDVVVEGADDRAILKWYLDNRCDTAVTVLEINSIDVPNTLVAKYCFGNGNRGRVLTLACELATLLDDRSRYSCTIIYDRDRDTLPPTPAMPNNTICTDFSCIEMYLFNSTTIGKFISIVLMTPELDADHTLKTLATVLVRLWVIKAANHLLRFGMTWVSFENICQLDGSNIRFDEAEFIQRYLMRNARLDDADVFRAKVDDIGDSLADDPRYSIDGHHFYDLARWYFRQLANNVNALRDQRGFERAISGCVELDCLDQFSLFQQLRNRVTM